MNIQELIKQKGGKLNFADFMRYALYHPEQGYYHKGRLLQKIEAKDFLTHPELTRPFFARGIANFIYHTWQNMNEPSDFWVVEMGGGTGILLRDLMDELDQKFPKFFKKLNFIMIEISPRLSYAQKQKLTVFQQQKVKWIIEDAKYAKIPKIKGVFLSNELVDSFPVHRIIWDEDSINEIYLSLDGDRIIEITDKLSRAEIIEYLEKLDMSFWPKQHLCINIEALAWLKNISSALDSGYILTIDYGDLAENLYGENRSKIRTNRHFFHGTYPYKEIGETDITSDVDFTSLILHGRDLGLEKSFFVPEHKFFRKYLLAEDIQDGFERTLECYLTGGFKVLLQHKHAPKIEI